MPEHEARIAALITRWRNGAASSDGEWEQCDQAELLRCADELEALLTAGEDVALQGEPAVLESPVTSCNSLKSCENTKESKCTLVAVEASPSRPMAEGWTPTAVNVNALPEPIRSYIHQLQTNCDPSGDTQERVIARDICRAQAIQLEQAEQQIATLRAERDQLQTDLYGKPPYRPGAYAQIELEIKVRDEYLTRAEAAEARVTALEAAAGALVAKLDVIIPKVDGLIAFQTVRTGHQAYDGPNLIAELADLRALLSPPPPSQETT